MGALRVEIAAESEAVRVYEEALLTLLERLAASLQARLMDERREREANERTLGSLLEQTCTGLGAHRPDWGWRAGHRFISGTGVRPNRAAPAPPAPAWACVALTDRTLKATKLVGSMVWREGDAAQ